MNICAWVWGIIACIFMLAGLIDYLMTGDLCGVMNKIQFFQIANSFLLLAILCKLCAKFDEKQDS